MADRPDQPPTAPPLRAPRETAQIRLRIATGFYDRLAVARETAGRILQEHALTPKN